MKKIIKFHCFRPKVKDTQAYDATDISTSSSDDDDAGDDVTQPDMSWDPVPLVEATHDGNLPTWSGVESPGVPRGVPSTSHKPLRYGTLPTYRSDVMQSRGAMTSSLAGSIPPPSAATLPPGRAPPRHHPPHHPQAPPHTTKHHFVGHPLYTCRQPDYDVLQPKSQQAYKGQLHIDIYNNFGLLTVHLLEGRHLASKWRPTCDCYVKVSLVPDEFKRTHCQSEIIAETNNPVFDEKFSFELMDDDASKRILISVWNHDPVRNCNEFLGCMSFGVRHILTNQKTAQGWYYLLPEDIGRKKHLQCVNNRPVVKEKGAGGSDMTPAATATPITTPALPAAADSTLKPVAAGGGGAGGVGEGADQLPPNVLWVDTKLFSIRRCRSGFGFTVMGADPVKVCKVEHGSPAEISGLQREDCIIKINHLNVSSSTADRVATVIRNSGETCNVEVQRPCMLPDHIYQPVFPASFHPIPSSYPPQHPHFPSGGLCNDASVGEDLYSSMQTCASTTPEPKGHHPQHLQHLEPPPVMFSCSTPLEPVINRCKLARKWSLKDPSYISSVYSATLSSPGDTVRSDTLRGDGGGSVRDSVYNEAIVDVPDYYSSAASHSSGALTLRGDERLVDYPDYYSTSSSLGHTNSSSGLGVSSGPKRANDQGLYSGRYTPSIQQQGGNPSVSAHPIGARPPPNICVGDPYGTLPHVGNKPLAALDTNTRHAGVRVGKSKPEMMTKEQTLRYADRQGQENRHEQPYSTKHFGGDHAVRSKETQIV